MKKVIRVGDIVVSFNLVNHELYTNVGNKETLKVWYRDIPSLEVVEKEIENQIENLKVGACLLDTELQRWFTKENTNEMYSLERHSSTMFCLSYRMDHPDHVAGDAIAFIPASWDLEKQKRIIQAYIEEQ